MSEGYHSGITPLFATTITAAATHAIAFSTRLIICDLYILSKKKKKVCILQNVKKIHISAWIPIKLLTQPFVSIVH